MISSAPFTSAKREGTPKLISTLEYAIPAKIHFCTKNTWRIKWKWRSLWQRRNLCCRSNSAKLNRFWLAKKRSLEFWNRRKKKWKARGTNKLKDSARRRRSSKKGHRSWSRKNMRIWRWITSWKVYRKSCLHLSKTTTNFYNNKTKR